MPSQKRTRNRRVNLTRYLVPDASSSWFLRNALFTGLAGWVFFSLAANLFHAEQLETLAAYTPVVDEALREELLGVAKRTTAVALGGAALTFLLFCAYSLHKIVGPLYRLQRHMIDVMGGVESNELTFRSDDRYQELRTTYNAFLHHVGAIQDRTEAARSKVAPGTDEAGELGAPVRTG
jgi:hypothetical protein